jgi:hypothetical protein
VKQYRVIKFFTDLQDKDYEYNVGDTFPREGKVVSDARIVELSTSANAQGTPLIQEAEELKEVKADEKSAKKTAKPKKAKAK